MRSRGRTGVAVAGVVVAFSVLSYACLGLLSAEIMTIVGLPDVACLGVAWRRHLGVWQVGSAALLEAVTIVLCTRWMVSASRRRASGERGVGRAGASATGDEGS